MAVCYNLNQVDAGGSRSIESTVLYSFVCSDCSVIVFRRFGVFSNILPNFVTEYVTIINIFFHQFHNKLNIF